MEFSNEAEWKKFLKTAFTNFDSLETNLERAKRNVNEKLKQAIEKRAKGNFGILFSGGVDSSFISLVAKNSNLNFKCYTIGFENSEDIRWAKKVANQLGLELKVKILKLEELEEALKKIIKILNETDVTKVGVGTVNFIASQLAKEDNIKILFSGLGSEEIFTGYQRHLEAFEKDGFEGAFKESWNGLIGLWQRDLQRDILIAKENKVEFKMPYLDKEVVKAAMQAHPMLKISKELNKIILREIAEDEGLPKEVAWRKKKASQYGSKVDWAIEKLAKKAGFRLKKDYLNSIAK